MSLLDRKLEMFREEYTQPFTPAQQAVLGKPVTEKKCQDIFDGTVRHLARQRRVSTARGGDVPCRYRGARGAQCAIGCHIPDAVYSRGMEGHGIPDDGDDSVWGWVVCHAAGMRSDKARRLAIALQNVHDSAAEGGSEANWRDALRRVAAKFRLSRKVFSEPDVVKGFNIIETGRA